MEKNLLLASRLIRIYIYINNAYIHIYIHIHTSSGLSGACSEESKEGGPAFNIHTILGHLLSRFFSGVRNPKIKTDYILQD